MLNFTINKEKCTGCGLCVLDCPSMIIAIGDYPYIKEGKESHCIKCQHCLAVCPEGALSIFGKNPDKSMLLDSRLPDPDLLSRMIKGRRSVRKYKNENLDKDLIQKLLETSSYAPTGHNDNSVLLSVVDNKEDFLDIKNAVYNAVRDESDKGNKNPNLPLLSKFQVLWIKKNIDVLFRGAPHMIVASSPDTATTAFEDSIIALSYFELAANSNGIGVLWNGMVKWVLTQIAPYLKERIGIPENHVIGGVLVFGRSDIRYSRAVQSEGLHVNRIKMK